MADKHKKTSNLMNVQKNKEKSYEKKSRHYSFGFLIGDY